jgi:hypothetical protein
MTGWEDRRVRLPRFASRTSAKFVPAEGPGQRFVPPVISRHDQLLKELKTGAEASWSTLALRACLEKVRDGLLTEQVAVLDAWTDGADAFCVVYTPPWGPTDLVGLRRTKADATEDSCGLGDYYNLVDRHEPDPIAYGKAVADFNLGEPLGSHTEELMYGADKFPWWGHLEETSPAWKQRRH